MEFGIEVPAYRRYPTPATLGRLAQMAEELGYESLWAPDHVVIPPTAGNSYRLGGHTYDPFSALGYAAAVTKRIKLATGVIVLAYRHPLAVAKHMATLDQMSGGRVIAGVGVGHLRDEFAALGVPFDERGDRTDEAIGLISEAWTSEGLHFEGQYYHVHDVVLEPRPVQRPRPPIVVGGNTRRAIRRAAELGDGWYPVQRTPEQARQGVALLKELCEAQGRPMVTVSALTHWVRLGQRASGQDGQRQPFSGGIEEMRADVRAYEAAGVTRLVLSTLAAEDEASLFQMVETFAKQVMGKEG